MTVGAPTLGAGDLRPPERAPGQAPVHRSPARRTASVRVLEIGVFVAYLVGLGFAIAVHEPWADEVQSWLLARDLSPAGLFVHQLRFEGSPGLWQLLLMPFTHAHLPLVTLNIVGGVVAASGVALLLFCSPLPLPLRVLLPFSYFALYQYGAIARSYNLMLPVLFGVAMAHRRRLERPLRYTLLLCLLAGITVQTMAVAGALFALLVIEGGRASTGRRQFVRRFRSSMAVFVATALVLVVVLWPPSDAAFHASGSLIGSPTALAHDFARLVAHAYVGAAWLNLVVIAAVCWWLASRRALAAFVVPSVAALLFSATKLHTLWFDGISTVLLVYGVWVGFDTSSPSHRARRVPRILTPLLVGVVTITAVLQVRWTALAVSWDAASDYGPGVAAAAYLADHGLLHRPVATTGNYWSIDLEPYLPSGRFSNLRSAGAYFPWSTRTGVDLRPILLARAPVVVATVFGPGAATAPPAPSLAGYRVAGEFPGRIFWQTGVVEHEDLVVYLRADLSG
jgi:hypothetical protein